MASEGDTMAGDYIRSRRLGAPRCRTQRALALHCGLSQSYISIIERGKHMPTLAPSRRIAAALCLNDEELARWLELIAAARPVRKGSPELRAKMSAANAGKRYNPAGEFKAGHRTWNKGLRGIHRSRATEFKPGERHGAAARNLRMLGSITEHQCRRWGRVTRSRWIKVSENGRPQDRWIPLARYTWERHRGPVPQGWFVVHRDGNTLDDRICNLVLMDRAGLPAWQKRIWPHMEARRRAAAARATTRRWAEYRAIKAARYGAGATKATGREGPLAYGRGSDRLMADG